ncbi:cytochrome P450 [Geodermatophilus sp. TF02-6]|uniref:cytochrome P450 n=1 Tax=Geodermatophilus sp. TF02-6 TaxID=2250575 RepID=UPI0018F3B5D5|nr:cytochrome P450 [Geodermatophilus sp. TF02-6]
MIPRLRTVDSSVGLLSEGYAFISSRCDRLGTDAFRTRLLLLPAVCMRGAEASRIFYGDDRFTRNRALPTSVQHLLQDEGSVQTLDGEAHRHRKQLFLDVLPQADDPRLREIFAEQWRAAARRWQGRDRVVLHDEMDEVLTRTAAAWAGVPLTEREVRLRTRELSAMVHNAGTVGWANWRARLLRNRCELWARQLVTRVRSGEVQPSEGRALAAIAAHRDLDGTLLDVKVAAVELLNVLRPTVAVSRFVVFAALALVREPRWRDTFAAGDEDDLLGFVQEVRRFYPFFPLIAGRVRQPFSWHGHDFALHDWVLLDLYGTNHDHRLWDEPEAFRPERFRTWSGDPDTLIPQGGGDPAENHRCPGEWATIDLLMEAVRLLTRATRYEVRVQDLSVSLSSMPTLPKSGVVIQDVRLQGEPSATR